ncbi:nuclease-related domain-containing protein [Kallotenue papyrolyticum]|uniref:nuclease-related domain-containing protein n=1 Tax=Kallotenue papyrolyticum TaxID=1325125 RepID=UPI0004BC7746|nr:nuclease-related domain-containing protein [Kallotenue papyrolyticum]
MSLLNDVTLAGMHADSDHVLVGPGGVWAIEVKHHAGVVQYIGDAWGYARIGLQGVPRAGQITDSARQAQRAALRLEALLRAHGIHTMVQPLVVFTHPLVELQLQMPSVPVRRALEVAPPARCAPEQLTPQQVTRIVAAICAQHGASV